MFRNVSLINVGISVVIICTHFSSFPFLCVCGKGAYFSIFIPFFHFLSSLVHFFARSFLPFSSLPYSFLLSFVSSHLFSFSAVRLVKQRSATLSLFQLQPMLILNHFIRCTQTTDDNVQLFWGCLAKVSLQNTYILTAKTI